MTAVLGHRVAVCSLKLLKEENYLLASDMGGEVGWIMFSQLNMRINKSIFLICSYFIQVIDRGTINSK